MITAGMVLYCGYWERPVAAMEFSGEPTASGDDVAGYVREWYEANRESWWDRHRPSAYRRGGAADEFVLALVGYVSRVQAAADAVKRTYLS